MWSRQHAELSSAALVLATLAAAAPLYAQAPASPDRPWPIPESFSVRAGQPEQRRTSVPNKQYDLVALIDLAERTNPQTRASWEVAREAAAAEGLVESSYLPQLSFEAIGGYEHTPLPAPKDLVPKGYFESHTGDHPGPCG
jgi:outer membrane protein TolC